MNKTFLILLLLGISYTAYNAVAVSENFEISTTIDHEIVLGNFRTSSADANFYVSGDIDMGLFVINTEYEGETYWQYSNTCKIYYTAGQAIVSASNQSIGYFTADIPNAHDCGRITTHSCGGLGFSRDYVWIFNLLGANSGWCDFAIEYSGHDNVFKAFTQQCKITDASKVTEGVHSGHITIVYNPE